MQPRNSPVADARYWTAISIASVFGANFGDFASHVLHLGHVRGLPPLALLFALTLLAERRARTGTMLFYWLAIVILRTAATNLADLATHDFHIGYGLTIAVFAAALAAGIALSRQSASAGGLPRTDLRYWATMLVAGTLGTALGDALSDTGDIGPGWASLIDGAVLALMFFGRARARSAALPLYWLTIVAIRTFGTTLGDFSADSLGLTTSTAASGLLFMGLLLAWRPIRTRRVARAIL